MVLSLKTLSLAMVMALAITVMADPTGTSTKDADHPVPIPFSVMDVEEDGDRQKGDHSSPLSTSAVVSTIHQSTFVRRSADEIEPEADMVEQSRLIGAQDWPLLPDMASKDSSASSLPSRPPSSSQSFSRVKHPSLEWIRWHLGSKSPYPHNDKPVGPIEDIPSGYDLVQIQLINRHGTRYPSFEKATAFRALTEKLKSFRAPGYDWLQEWSSDAFYPPAKGNLLAPKGDADLYQIGRRFAIRYKAMLNKYPYDANTYEFQSSAKSRSSQSAYGFSIGFFQGRYQTDEGVGQRPLSPKSLSVQPIDIFTVPLGMDTEMAVKYACPRWIAASKDAKNSHQKSVFKARILPSITSQLSAQFSQGSKVANLTEKDVENIYQLCGFEVAFFDQDQTWCQLLRQAAVRVLEDGSHSEPTEEDTKATFLNLEILRDIGEFYSLGLGVPFNKHLGCTLATSLVASIDLALTPDTIPKTITMEDGEEGDVIMDNNLFRGIFKFGHSETITLFSTFLGLYDNNGIPLTGNMTTEEYAQRRFWTSQIAPFASNMGFEVFRPKVRPSTRRLTPEQMNGPTPTAPKVWPGLVRLLVNEVPMLIPGCGPSVFCEWSTFKTLLQKAGAGCDFAKCCSVTPSVLNGENTQHPVCLSTEPVA